jgi:hypothetical protein
MFADSARTRFGVSGLGAKIGVLSDSYNALKGEAKGIASGDLPGPGNPKGKTKPVQVLSDYLEEDAIDEGRAMIEITHDVAPDAELAFHTAVNGQADFAQGIVDLADTGCDVIVDDIIYFAEPFFQDGIIAQAVDEVTRKGSVYFSAAGNEALRSYESVYRPTNVELVGEDNGTAHNFAAPGARPQYLQPVRIPGRGTFIISFQWDDPFFSHSTLGVGATTDMDIYLLDQTGRIVAVGGSDNIGRTGDPVELLGYFNPKPDTANAAQDVIFYLAITKYAGPNPTRIKSILYGDGDFYPTAAPIPGRNSPTITGHSNAAGAIAVGAAFYQQTPAFSEDTTARLEPFSSVGGVPVLFNTSGFRKDTAEVRMKPEIVGPDGGNTTFFFSDTRRDADTLPNFFGTSASAPHVAAVAALMIEARRNPLTREQVWLALQRTALDMDNPYTRGFDVGFDYATGSGFVQADKAVAAVAFTLETIANLQLSSVCSEDPDSIRRWQIYNPNAFRVKVGWTVPQLDIKDIQKDIIMAPPGNSHFVSKRIQGPNVAIIAWEDEKGNIKVDTKLSSSTVCDDTQVAVASGDQAGRLALVAAYPNPTAEQLYIQFLDQNVSEATLKLYNTKGNIVYSQYIKTVKDKPATSIDVSKLPAGLYVLQVGQGLLQQQALKVVIQK